MPIKCHEYWILVRDWESMESRSSLPLVSPSLSYSQALELIKSVITQRCVCLLLQIPELDKSFQGCSLKCHVMSRAAGIGALNVLFLPESDSLSCLVALFHPFLRVKVQRCFF